MYERDSRLCNTLHINGVQAASHSSMNFVLSWRSGQFRIQVGRIPVQRVTLRVIAVISLATALVSQAVSFPTQPAELELTMPSVTRWVCMDCQQPNQHGAPGQGSYFADYKSAACHYARSSACNKSNRGLCTVTVVSRPSDSDACGGGAAGAWPSSKGTI